MSLDLEPTLIDVLNDVDQPVENAKGIPAQWYTDPDIFALEQERIFRKTWMAVCFSEEVSDAGDVFPAKIAGSEIVVVRDQDGTIRALHNICRHRASLVVREPAKGLHSLKCHYHCWTYGLDGELRNAPFFDGSPSCKAKCDGFETSLAPIRCGEWEGIVFVNLDGKAPSLEEYVKPLAERWRSYDTASFPRFKMVEGKVIPANWKVVMEGLLEVYHEEFIHKDLTYRLNEDGEKTFEDIWAGEMVGFRSIETPDHPEMALPRLPGMPESGPAPTEIFLLFPSVSLNILDNHMVRTIWTFGSHKETRWKSTWHFAPGAADSEEGKTLCQDVVDFWDNVRKEDLRAVLSVQAGLQSRTDEPIITRYSPFWEPILQHFHRRLTQGLLEE